METSAQLETDQAIEQAIAPWIWEKHYRVFPISIRYSAASGLASLVFENGAIYQFNPLHIQEITLKTLHPTAEQLGNIVKQIASPAIFTGEAICLRVIYFLSNNLPHKSRYNQKV